VDVGLRRLVLEEGEEQAAALDSSDGISFSQRIWKQRRGRG
jgi:hypothetical protein